MKQSYKIEDRNQSISQNDSVLSVLSSLANLAIALTAVLSPPLPLPLPVALPLVDGAGDVC